MAMTMTMDSFFNGIQDVLGDFHTPVILKRDDEGLQKQMDYLESHRSVENNKKLNGLKKGAEGEANVLYQLEHSGIGMYVLHGVHVDDAQIDFVVITRGWVYLIECKNWSGDWKVRRDGTILIRNGNKVASYHSPIVQSQRHMETVKERWRQKNNRVANILFSSLFEKNWYKSLVVVSNYKSVIDLEEASKYDKEHIVRADQLPSFIKSDLKKYGEREPFSSKKQMMSIAEGFLRAEKEYKSTILARRRSS